MVVSVVAVVSALLCVGAVLYMVSGQAVGRDRGSFRRLFHNIPLQSVKIVIVAWQILTQVRPKNMRRGHGFKAQNGVRRSVEKTCSACLSFDPLCFDREKVRSPQACHDQNVWREMFRRNANATLP